MQAEAIAAPTQTAVEHGSVGATIARWGLRAAVFLLPLAFLPNIVDEFVLPKLLLARLFIAVSIALLLVRWLQQGTVTWKRTPLDLPLVAFIGSAALSTVFAINRNVAIFGTYDRWEGLLTIVTYGLVFWLAVQLLSGEADARGLTWSLLVSGYVIAAVAILQSAFGLLGGGYFRTGNNIIRPDVTLANPDFLGIFLGMLLPVAFAKLVSRRPITTRALAANLVVVLFLGLLVSLTRAGWIGAVVGVVIVLVLRRGRFHVWPFLISISILVVAFAVLIAVASSRSSSAGGGFGQALLGRIASSTDFSSGNVAARIKTWGDTLPLIASRPIVGYGPDTFGLVYPQFERINQRFVLWDKPHQDALGVAASQGVIGLLAYNWVLVAFVRAFWKGRYQRGAVALFAGWVAYVVAIQADFSWIPTSIPFWLFAAAAIVTWSPKLEPVRVAQFPRRIAVAVLAAGSIALIALLVPGVVLPYLADADYYAAQGAPNLQQARATIAQARQFAPYEAVYANVAGNYALNQDQNGTPSSNADWAAAREAYEAAARLGSYSPEMFRELAIVDEHLGDHAGAVTAARRALELDRYDPESQLLLNRLSGQYLRRNRPQVNFKIRGMKVQATGLEGLTLIGPEVFRDNRGFFLETYSRRRYLELGIDGEFVQDNHSHSTKGVLRGLHYQDMSAPMAKLVRCAVGATLDVAVDLRVGSPTFGKWFAVELSPVNARQLFIPVGFGHAFLVLSDTADIEYKCTGYYDKAAEGVIAWNDPQIGIDWPEKRPILSPRDANGMSLSEYLRRPAFVAA